MSKRCDICEAVAAFMKGPRTGIELGEMLGIGRNARLRILRHLRDAGLIYISHRCEQPMDEDGNIQRGARMPVYTLQPTPFAHEDVPVRK